MGRKDFVRHLDAARTSHGVEHIHDVQRGEDDGQLTFVYIHSSLETPIFLTALVTGERIDPPKDVH